MTAATSIHYDAATGWLAVEHDGTITWDELQAIKNDQIGENVIAIEVYPPENEVINKGNVRHLWRWDAYSDPIPNLHDYAAGAAT
ncbi:MAG: hypothetical protein AAGK66_02800 [Pseudomonadota bacterium]